MLQDWIEQKTKSGALFRSGRTRQCFPEGDSQLHTQGRQISYLTDRVGADESASTYSRRGWRASLMSSRQDSRKSTVSGLSVGFKVINR